MKIFKFELTKIIKNKTFIGGLIISLLVSFGIFFVGYYYSQNYSAQRSNEKYGYSRTMDKKIKKNYQGDLTNDLVHEITTDYLTMRQDALEKRGVSHSDFAFYPFYWEIVNHFAIGGMSDVADKMNAAAMKHQGQITVADISLKDVNAAGLRKFSVPLKLGNYVPWTDFFKVSGNIFLLCNVLVVLICATVFADDTSRNINQLLFTTKYGRTKMNYTKNLAAISISIGLLFLFVGLNYAIFSVLFDTSGINGSIQANFSLGLEQFPKLWSHSQLFFFLLILQLLAILFTASVTLFISALSNSTMTSFATALGIFFLPYLLKELLKVGIGNQILMLFPINLANPIQLMLNLSNQEFLLGDFSRNVLLLIITFISCKVILQVTTYYKMKNWHFC